MNYRIVAVRSGAELYIYDVIGAWLGGITAKTVVDDVKALGKIDTLNVHINSPGGDVFEGIAIYNYLKQHRAKVVVDIDGIAASIASVIAMSGDSVRMAMNATFMIHNPMAQAFGSAADLRKKAVQIDLVKDNIVATYQAHTKLGTSKLTELMAAETWMKATEAQEHGFVDEITEDLQMAASFDLSHFKNAPKISADVPHANTFRARIAANEQRLARACLPVRPSHER